MKIGSLIKFHRTKKGMTQNELAKGICSIPHLSKIENNSKEANEETIRLLLLKLGVELKDVEESENEIKNLLNELANNINYGENEKAIVTFQKLQSYNELITFTNLIYLYELYKLRYYIFIAEYEKANLQFSWLNSNKKNFSQYEKYLHSYLNGLMLVIRGKYEEADIELTSIIKESYDFGIFEAELYYYYAMIKGRLGEDGKAIIYGRKALEIYKNQFNLIRISYNLLLLGINYTHEEIFDEAQEMFEYALRNCQLLNQKELLPNIYQNLGSMYEKKHELSKSLYYFDLSVHTLDKSDPNYLRFLFNLSFVQYKSHKIEDSKKNLELLKEYTNREHIFNLLATFYLKLIENKECEAMALLEEKVIPIISNMDDLYETRKDLMDIFKRYLLKQGQFEKALKYI